MTPVFMQALGSDFDRLHPNLAWRYSIDSTSGVALMATGIMESIYVSSAVPSPLLRHYGNRAALPRRSSRMVPFCESHYCYQDELKRESLAILRTFDYSSGPHRFNSVKVFAKNGVIRDHFGDGPELLTDLEVSVNSRGDLLLESGPLHWLGKGPKLGMRRLFDARMKYMEGWDERNDRFRCDATVRAPMFGEIFHLRGWFTASDQLCSLQEIPDEAWTERLVDRDT
ncbi:DUF4166 domain-containing protein [Gordonia sp. ABSL49_1]|uniref:DUF4166 domain-containing protein n=1 Tax=Gordonia sp. ABSL49_1 TaxID=2920941 RepID=UPI001F10B466|nr:DUF4166 domain-containing protein [Gordonia sp. ABSL49_1]MCH5644026.1 DUF4166 domain-containing protein [Gordonia sp. ABSL49_1]